MNNIRSSYYTYLDISKAETVDLKTYVAINNLFNKFIVSEVLEGKEITFPCNMGTLGLIGREQKITFEEDGNIRGLAVDFKRTNELWSRDPEAKANKKLVYHMNDNTENIRYKYVWNRLKAKIKNKMLYSLVMTRTNKRTAAKCIKSGKQYKVRY